MTPHYLIFYILTSGEIINSIWTMASALGTPREHQIQMATMICNGYFPKLAGLVIALFTPIFAVEQSNDSATLLRQILRILRYDRGPARFVYEPLIYIKQHTSILRHRVPGAERIVMTDPQIVKCIYSLANLMVALEILNRIELLPTAKCHAAANEFYLAYHDFGRTILNLSNLGPKEVFAPIPDPSAPTEIETHTDPMPTLIQPLFDCPQGQSIRWYRTNGFAEFLRDKIWIPQDSSIAGMPCRLLRYNGTNSVVTYGLDETRKYLKSTTCINWFNSTTVDTTPLQTLSP